MVGILPRGILLRGIFLWRHFAGRDFSVEGFCKRLFLVEGFSAGGIFQPSPLDYQISVRYQIDVALDFFLEIN